MDETIVYVNNSLNEGYSIVKIEKELNYGKDTLRKKINRAGFQYDKALKKFIFDANTVVTQDITHAENNIITKPITQSNNTNVTQPSSPRAFTDEDFKILFKIIDDYKSKDDCTSKNENIVIPKNDSEITTRSFRSYKNVFDSFSEYCKDNSLNQKDAIADALISYISR